MKRRLISVLSIFAVVLVTVAVSVAVRLHYRNNNDSNDSNDANYSTLHFSPVMCEAAFYGIKPEEFCTTRGAGTFLENRYLEAKVDADGCLILTLENDVISEWKNTFVELQMLQCVFGDTRDIGITIDYSMDFMSFMENADTCGFEISEDFTEIIASPDDNRWYCPFITLACQTMQIFEGKTCTEVKVTYMEINDEGEIVYTSVSPDDTKK